MKLATQICVIGNEKNSTKVPGVMQATSHANVDETSLEVTTVMVDLTITVHGLFEAL